MFERFRSAVFNRQRKKWEKKRSRGKRFFILYWGVLRWGGIMCVLTTITNVLARHMKLNWLSEISLLIGSLFSGYVWARCTWYVNERRFKDAIKQQDSIKVE